jgi:hypothetical protein
MMSSTVLQSEGRTITAPPEGESAPDIIQELDALFSNDPSQIPFSYLEALPQRFTSDI